MVPQSPADKAGLKKGCTIVSLNGKPIDSFNSFRYEIGRLDDLLTVAKSHQDSLKVRSVTLVYSHDNRQDTVKTVLNADLTMGFNTKSIAGLYQRETIEYGFWESFPAGASYGMGVLKGYVDDMKYVFSADGAKSLGGFGAIGSLFPPTWDWYMFWRMTAFLSIILAFMNILPIPALDGGHVLFLLYEMITRRKPSEDFLIKAEYVGFALLILLMLVANLNDILRWLGYM